MPLTINDYKNFMLSPTHSLQLLAKFEWLQKSDESVYSTFSAEVTGGSLTVSRGNGSRRSVSINVHNIYNTFTPHPLRFWVNDRFRLSLGYVINGEEIWISQGVFILRNPTTVHQGSEKSATITAIDKFSNLDGTLNGRLDASYQIPVGTSLISAIKSVLSLCGDPIPPLLIIDSSIVLPYTVIKEAGSTYGELLLELNHIVSYNMFYNTNGEFVCEPDTPNDEKGSEFDFIDDIDVAPVYQGIQQTFNFEQAYNKVLVIGDNVNGNQALGVATNNDPSSPLSVLNIGYRLAPVITDSVIDTDQRATDRANYELKRYASLAVEANISCIPLIHLDVDKVCTVTDSHEQLDREKFLINSLTIPFDPEGGNIMNIGASKLTEIDFDISN